MAVNINFKLLDFSNSEVRPVDQLVHIFNRMFGGNPSSEIADSVSIVAEAAILEIAASHQSSDFYENRAGIEYEMQQSLQTSFKAYYLTLTSVFILNLDFDDSFQNAIIKVMAESQKIQEKTNLLNGTLIQGQTSIGVAQLEQSMRIARASNEGQVYARVQASKATAVAAYYNKLIQAVTTAGTFTGNNSLKDLQKFFYLVVRRVDPGDEDDPISKKPVPIQSGSFARGTVGLTTANSSLLSRCARQTLDHGDSVSDLNLN